METEYDAVIIGAGPAGYTAAIRIAQLGGKACLVEKNKIGGVCTNTGCIPTKTLVSIAKRIKEIKKISEVKIDFTQIKEEVAKTVENTRKGVEYLIKKNNIEIINGEGIIGYKEVRVNNNVLKAKNVIVATGSKAIKIDQSSLTSDDILNLQSIPQKLTIIGAGYIGMEFASIFSILGSEVTVVEQEERALPHEDQEISGEIIKLLDVKFELGKKNYVAEGVVLEATGRIPSFNKENMDRLGVKYERGIITNERMKSNIDWLYAIGDVNDKFPLAHVAIREAIVAAENVMGLNNTMNYDNVPHCIFTVPEIASIGKREGVSGKFPFLANGKSQTSGNKEGFVKVYINEGKLAGASIIGADASSLIAVVQCLLGKSVSEIKKIVFAHPSLPEAIMDAVLQASNEAINL